MLPLLALLFPYTVINRRLQNEKKAEIEAVSLQIQNVFLELEERVRAGELSDNISLKATIDNLNTKKEYVESIPTWPWRTGVFRVTFSAILLPIVVYIIQQLFDRYVIR